MRGSGTRGGSLIIDEAAQYLPHHPLSVPHCNTNLIIYDDIIMYPGDVIGQNLSLRFKVTLTVRERPHPCHFTLCSVKKINKC